MPHVLLTGEDRNVASLRCLLTKWGVTTGRLPSGSDLPTVHDADGVILIGKDTALRVARGRTLPEGSGGAGGPVAPVICVSEGAGGHGLPAAWLVLERVESDGANLRLALRSTFSRAHGLRGDADPMTAAEAAADTYLHFLGHELRSPLTAVKTSLEVLESELGGPGDERQAGCGKQRMLAIARRNVRRLHRTVEWSQDLLASRCAVGPARPRQTSVAEFAARLRGLGAVHVALNLDHPDFLTDPDLLENLVTQLVRTLILGCPDRPLTIALDREPGGGRLRIAVAATEGAGHPAVAHRTRLVRPDDPAPIGSELERLAGFMIAPGLLAALDAILSVGSEEGSQTLAVHLATIEAVPATP